MRNCDVLIVGAGPVGLVAGMDLAQRGIDAVVVDERTSYDPLTVRCNHISARSMEVFRRLGLAEDVRAAGFEDDFPHDAAFRTTLTGTEIARIKIPGRKGRQTGEQGPDTSWPTPEPPHRLNQIYLEPIMFSHAEKTDGLTLQFDRKAVAIEQTDDGVKATLESENGERFEIHAKFLIGCDGGGSFVRKAIGAQLEGDPVIQRVQSTFIHAPGLTALMEAKPAWSTVNLNPRRAGSVFTIDNDDRFLVHNYLRPHETDFAAIDRDRSLRIILGIDDDFQYEVLRVEDWIGRRMVANKIREGRIFLAGDAAHIWVPYGGYGMNAGIADAADLTWLLAAHLQGWGGAGMLDAYQAERLPITEQVSQFAMNRAEILIRKRGSIPDAIEDDTPEGETARIDFGKVCYELNLPQYCCGGLNFGYFYDASPIIVYDGEQAPEYTMGDFTPSTVPGCRMPHVYMDDGSSLYDHLGPGYTLVRAADQAKGESLLNAARQSGVPITPVDMPANADFDFPLYLVRPDQHIAWRGQTEPEDPAAIVTTLSGKANGA